MNIDFHSPCETWDAFVAANPRARNYHRWTWLKVVEATYGHKPYYLAAVAGGTIHGILPLALIKSRLWGRSLVSVPFFSYGGVLADTDEATHALLKTAAELGVELGVRHIELRQGRELSTTWTGVAPKVTMEIDLPAAVDDLFARLSPKMRKRIRYASNHGLEARWGGAEVLHEFYRIFATNMRNLGTPVYPYSWFENICRAVPGGIRILIVYDTGKPVAAGFISLFRDTVELPWAASLPESRDKFSTLLLYWSLLEWSLENGYRRIDLGRCTPGSGNYEFKRRWVCNERPLNWYYWLAGGAAVPQLRADNSKYRWAVGVWKHLPLPITTAVGPLVVRSLP